MSDQYDSGNSDRSGASPWNSPDPTGAPVDRSTYGSDATAGSQTPGQYGTTPQGAPSYSQASYPESAYGQQAGNAQQFGAYGGAAGQPGYPVGPKPQGLAITSLVLGLIGLLTSWFPILGLGGVLLALIAIILGIVALMRVRKGTGGGKGLAIGGIVTGALGLVLGLLINVALLAGMGQLAESGSLDAIAECSKLPQAEQQACVQREMQNLEQQQQQQGDRT